MAHYVKIKRGLDIPLTGKPTMEETDAKDIDLYAISPDDYPGLTWKASVKEGDTVSVGGELLHAKEDVEIRLTSPVSGRVVEVRRGARRRIIYISIRREGTQNYPDIINRLYKTTDLRSLMKLSGIWAMMRQRPFDIVPSGGSEPRDIFITAFDTAPLAGPMMRESDTVYLKVGIHALKGLTKGNVYLGVRPGTTTDFAEAEVYEFDGPHPAGNAGTQIAAIRPVNKGETVWTLDARTAIRLGRLIKDGEPDMSATVAICGEDAKNPSLVNTIIGASLSQLLDGRVKTDSGNVRINSGNVLCGTKSDLDNDFLRYPYRQVTLIPEGDHADEFMGWASLNPSKFSVKRSFPAFLRGAGHRFNIDARIKGGRRAPILSGEYDKVFPFDIYPEYLLKAIESGDIDKMEKLGIYEVAPEDFALAEFVDTSKNPLQKTVRDGLDKLRKELE